MSHGTIHTYDKNTTQSDKTSALAKHQDRLQTVTPLSPRDEPMSLNMVKPLDFATGTSPKGPRIEDFSLSEHDADSSFMQNFSAIFYKRFLLYQSWRSLFVEILGPAMIMIVGTCLISIDMFERTESRLLSPARIADKNQMIMIN